MLVGGCEAKLRLDEVEATREQAIRRSDQFQAAVATAERVVVVGTHGVIVTSSDQGTTWHRHELDSWPSLIDVAACPDGSLAALAYERELWTAPATGEQWTLHKLESKETPQALTCDPQGRLWIVGSFSSIQSSSDGGKTWSSQTLDEDLFLTSIQFLDPQHAFATGEFGTVLKTSDGGATWQRLANLPDEFYPEDAWFKNLQQGWVAGLQGGLLMTGDGGQTWSRQDTGTFAPLYSLGTVAGVPYVVGGEGVVLRLANDQWRKIDYVDQSHGYLRVVLEVGHDKLLVAGGGGIARLITDVAAGPDVASSR
jgi:photosystem II stability/assembly factor-like uncharacterized protein